MEEAKGPQSSSETQALLDAVNSDPMLFHPPGPGEELPMTGQSALNNAHGVEDDFAKAEMSSPSVPKKKKKKNKKKKKKNADGETD